MKQTNGSIMIRRTILFTIFFVLIAACIKLFLANFF